MNINNDKKMLKQAFHKEEDARKRLADMLPGGRSTATPVRHRSTIKPRTANNINLTQIVNCMPPIERTTNIREKQRLVQGIPRNDQQHPSS